MKLHLILAVIGISLQLVLASTCYRSERVYCVNSNQSNSSLQSSNSCQPLDNYVSKPKIYFTSNSTFLFLKGQHQHNYQLQVNNVSNLCMLSNDPETLIVCNKANVGFTFKNVTNITLVNLVFTKCGQRFRSEDNRMNIATLAFIMGTNLNLTNIVTNYSNVSGVYIININGPVTIQNSTFANAYNRKVLHYGGNSIIYNCFTRNRNPLSDMKLKVTDTKFMNNSFDRSICNQSNDQLASGLFLLVKCSRAFVEFTNVHFVNNSGCEGGNMAMIVYTKNLTKNFKKPMRISDCFFVNGNSGRGGGGGIFISIVQTSQKSVACADEKPLELINIERSKFINNTAAIGGGIFLRLKESLDYCSRVKIGIAQSTFERNTLSTDHTHHGGLAIHSIVYVAYGFSPHTTPQYHLEIVDCNFTHHRQNSNHWDGSGSGVIFTKSNSHSNHWDGSGSGVIFTKSNSRVDIKDTNIVENQCSGIVAITSNLVLSGVIEISRNNASSGGGLFLCLGTVLYFDENTTLTIADNHVEHAGGGITVEDSCLQSQPTCFFQPANTSKELSTIGIYLTNNTAEFAGDNLYGGSIDYCYIIKEPLAPNQNVTDMGVFNEIFHIYPNNTITSSPRRTCFCHGSQLYCKKNTEIREVYPGGKFSLELAVIGQNEGHVPGTVKAQLNTSMVTIYDPIDKKEKNYQVNDLEKECREISYITRSNCNECGPYEMEIFVRLSGDISFIEHLTQYKSIYVTIKIKRCPLGFELKKSFCECNSMIPDNYKLECCITQSIIKRPLHSKVWIGTIAAAPPTMTSAENVTRKNDLIIAKPCPFDYCISVKVAIKANEDDLEDQDKQCQSNRVGVLCGMCKENASISLGTSTCIENCSNNHITLILLFLLLGILLVLFLTMLNLTVAEGTINGILFYANIFQINNELLFQGNPVPILTPFLKVFIAWLNLDFGISVCFYDGMDMYSKTMLQYLFPIYIWLLSGAIIFFSNRFRQVATLFGKNGIKVLATMILLSYAKMLQLVISAQRYQSVLILKEDGIHEQKRWALDGNIIYLKGKHITLFAVSLITAFILLPFSLCLLFIHRLYKYSDHRPFLWVNRLKPFFDTYIGPCTNAGCCWTGLLLLVRIVVFISSTAFSYTQSVLSSIIIVFIVCLLLTVAWVIRPGIYKQRSLNILESVSLINLALLYCYNVYAIHEDVDQRPITHASAIVAFLTFVTVLSYHSYQQITKLNCIKIYNAMKSSSLITKNLREIVRDDNGKPSHNCMYFDEDREPLLSDNND